MFFTRATVLITDFFFIIIVLYVFVSQFYRIPFNDIQLFNCDLTMQPRLKLVVLYKTHNCNTNCHTKKHLNVNNVVYV